MVTMYDPIVDAYRQVELSKAKKFVEEANKLKKRIEEVESK